MESVLVRYRNLIILVGVLFLQVLGLAVQVKRGGNQLENTRLIRIWAVSAITPFERAFVWVEDGTSNLWHNYFYLRGVRNENRELKEQIEQMRLEQVRLREDATQARRLQTLLAFKEQFVAKTVAAQVIGSSASDLSRIVYIDKGENEGLKRDMAVITADGVVGKVLLVYPSVAQVLLINDQSSGVGALLEKTRLQGVLRGTASGELMLERMMSDEQVPLGETVVTSGGDQIFPKGLPIGTVAKVGPGKDLFLSIKVKPAADLSKLEEVLVLVERQEREAVAEGTGHTRAADILAQRLPSVPDKPAQPANATVGTTSTAATTGAGTKPGGASTAQTAKKLSGAASEHLPAGAIGSADEGVRHSTAGGTATTSTSQKTPATPKAPAAEGATTGSKPQASPSKPAVAQPSQASPSAVPSSQPASAPPSQPSSQSNSQQNAPPTNPQTPPQRPAEQNSPN
jgi:rod shape-determining protein MreC